MNQTFMVKCSECGNKHARERIRKVNYCSTACRMKAYRLRPKVEEVPTTQVDFPAAKISEKRLERYPVWEIAPDIFVHDTEPGCGPHPKGYPIKRAEAPA